MNTKIAQCICCRGLIVLNSDGTPRDLEFATEESLVEEFNIKKNSSHMILSANVQYEQTICPICYDEVIDDERPHRSLVLAVLNPVTLKETISGALIYFNALPITLQIHSLQTEYPFPILTIHTTEQIKILKQEYRESLKKESQNIDPELIERSLIILDEIADDVWP